MRKRNIEKTFDVIMWTLITLLPIIGYLIYLQSFGANPAIVGEDGVVNTSAVVAFSSYLSYSGFYPATSGIVYQTFNGIIGLNGILPLFPEHVIRLFVWFVHVQIVHLIVDFLLWLPRFAHKFMDKSMESV